MNLRNKIAIGALTGVLGMTGALVTWFEGRSLVAYLDPVGIPTICEGVTQGVKLGDRATPAQCDQLLQRELGIALTAVDRQVRVPLPDTRRAALGSFVYNVGEGQFSSSTLLRLLNAGDARGACAQLSRWIYAGGKQLAGLVNRRAAERELCEEGL
ncbi:glycoside hydrolase family protein [Pseudomonas sp. FSL R10-2964]|uniref:lysozyme n=1 Tax=Pseudomonas sp. FSL R10-2964 TaxID=2662202 RepID=UPI001295277A|nr:lysozyme [Pseudomonas sp. FSL R10-2964]MQT87342.1 glycoside hydrolase family protein [Pseudomonas sp. FSL R10-2964]